MTRTIFALTLLLLGQATLADMNVPPQAHRAVADASMVVNDRGARLEVYPLERAHPHADALGRGVSHEVVRADAASPIGAHELGVVFNHAMQQQGYISGEIAFQMKPHHKATGFSPALYPGLKEVLPSGLYVVAARTPSEFVTLMKRLQERTDIQFVEPTVVYGPAAPPQAAR